MNKLEKIAEVIKTNKIASFFTLGGILTAAAVDAGLISQVSGFGKFFLNNFSQISAAGLITQSIFKMYYKKEQELYLTFDEAIQAKDKGIKTELSKEDSIINNKDRNTFSCGAFLALTSFYISDFIKAGMPLQASAHEFNNVVGISGALLAVSGLTIMAVKAHHQKKMSQ